MALLSAQSNSSRRDTYQPPRSRAFFLELLLNMLVFALCAVIALQVFAQGKLATDQSAALSKLTLEARDLAAQYKVTNGDLSELVTEGTRGDFGVLGNDGSLTYYYDNSFQLTGDTGARYRLVLSPAQSTNDLVSVIQITGYTLDDEIFSFEVANYQGSGAQSVADQSAATQVASSQADTTQTASTQAGSASPNQGEG